MYRREMALSTEPTAPAGTSTAGTGDSDRLIETFDPRTGALLAVVPDQSDEEVRAAIGRARAAFGAWSALTYKERSAHIMRIRDRMLDRADELVGTICAETGKQRAEAVSTELMVVCEMIEWYAKHGEAVLRTRSVGPAPWPTRRPGSATSPWASSA